jgi:hypothetical protein
MLTILRRTTILYLQIKKLAYQNLKVQLPLYTSQSCPCTRHKVIRESRSIAPFILNLDNMWRRVLSFMLRPPYLPVKHPWHPLSSGLVEPQSRLHAYKSKTPWPTRSPLSYPGTRPIFTNLFLTQLVMRYIKSCSHKCTPFIICYLIQFILNIVQHVSNYVTVHLQGLNCLLHQLYTYSTHYNI